MSDSAGPRRPNILHLLSDQHSPYVAGCYGDSVVQTPHLDRLAAGGVTLDAVYCPSPICVPSRMSMLTGRHPYQNACWTNSHILDSGIPTFAHALGAAGYRTCLAGRMHSLGPDQLRGYSERLVGDHSPNFDGNPSPRGGPGRHGRPGPCLLARSGPGQGGYQVHDEVVTAAAVDWLNRLGTARRSAPPGPARPPSSSPWASCCPTSRSSPGAPSTSATGRVPGPRSPRPSQPEHPYLTWWRARTGSRASRRRRSSAAAAPTGPWSTAWTP